MITFEKDKSIMDGNGVLKLVINVTNWVLDGDNARVEQVNASPIFTLDIYPSADLYE